MDNPRELFAVEAKLRTPRPVKLMHPISRCWGIVFPARRGAEDNIYIPRGKSPRQLKDLRIKLRERGVSVVEVRGARIGGAVRFSMGGRFHVPRAQYGQPHDIGPEVRARILFENTLLNFGDPPKTYPSGWVEQEQQSHFSQVFVELGPQRLEFVRKRRDGQVTGGRGAGRKPKKQGEGQKFSSHAHGLELHHRSPDRLEALLPRPPSPQNGEGARVRRPV